MKQIHSVNKSLLSDERLLQLSKNTTNLLDSISLSETSSLFALKNILSNKCAFFSELLTPTAQVEEKISKKEYDKMRSSSGMYFYGGITHGADSPNYSKAEKFTKIQTIIAEMPAIVKLGFEVESARLDLIFDKLDLTEYQTLISEVNMIEEYDDWKEKHQLFKDHVYANVSNDATKVDHSIRETREELKVVFQHIINQLLTSIYLNDALITSDLITQLNKIIDDQMIPARIAHTREKNERDALKLHENK